MKKITSTKALVEAMRQSRMQHVINVIDEEQQELAMQEELDYDDLMMYDRYNILAHDQA